jgi:endonuclease/exonuclease/phosphatase family metal-dependent hydrolase
MRIVTIILLSLFAQAPLQRLAAGEVETAQGRKTLRLMTYNIHHGEGMDAELDLERLAKVITGCRPDLVAVQEVDVKTRRSEGVDQAAELARLTGMHYAFGKFMDFDGGEYGQMVLSKFPIAKVRNLPLPAGPEPRAALAVDVDLDGPAGGGRLVFVGNHFYATEEERVAQALRLTESLAEEIAGGVPVILAGDFNSTPESKPMAILGKHWVDPTLGKNRHTWPSDRPRVEIDHILYSPAPRFKFVKSKVLVEKIASDHRPVLTVLKLLEEG